MNGIKLKNVTKKYKNRIILDNINFDVSDGELILLQGKSGAGKTTLFNIISGLEPINSGEIVIGGKNISKLREKERRDFYRTTIGIVHQGFYLQPQMNIAKNIALPGFITGIKKEKLKERVLRLAKELEIEEILGQKPDEISGGQAERACIARAIFMNPKVVLADEPTNNLDPENCKNVADLLYETWQRNKCIMIIASHDREFEKYNPRIIALENGKVL